MKDDYIQQKGAYRKGLVLGFTMAEIMLLIIFALLLCLPGIIDFMDKKNKEMEKDIQRVKSALEDKSETIAALEEKVEELLKYTGKNDFEDIFKELQLAQIKEKELASLQEKVNGLEEKSKTLAQMEKVLGQKLENRSETEKILKELLLKVSNFEKLEKRLVDLGVDPGNPDGMKNVLDNIQRELANLKGQNKNLRHKLSQTGNGLEMPACWANPDTGKPEYIFDVALTSNGLIIHDKKLGHRQEEQKKLPLESISFDVEISSSQFMVEAHPLFDWSVKKECRFFVRVFDLTKAEEKKLYKERMTILETRFYKYEVRGEVAPFQISQMNPEGR